MWPSADQTNLSRLHYALLILVSLAFFLPGIASLPPTDRDESRFAQATKQMIESGNYTDIHFQDEVRYKKPVGIYWLQSAAVQLTGAPLNDIWAYRLPSLLAAIGAVLLTAAIGARLFSPATGMMAALLMAGSLLLNIEARLAKTDAVLLLTVLAAHYAIICLWLKRTASPAHAALFWLALGCGALIKGPIILLPVVPVLIWICWQARSGAFLKNLQPLWGIPLFLLIVTPWFVMITLKSGSTFWSEAAGKDLIGKMTGGKESHGMPPGYYLVTFWATFWPGSILALLALPFIRANWRSANIQLLLTWLIPAWLVFEAVPTKLPHYTLPLFPAIAILTGAALQAGLPAFKYKAVKYLGWLVWAAVTVGGLAGFALLPYAAAGAFAKWQIIAGFTALAIASYWLVKGASLPSAKRVAVLVLTGFIFTVPLFDLTLPAFTHIWISKQVQTAMQAAGCPQGDLISARFNEPSLVFLNGTQTVLNAKGIDAARFLIDPPEDKNSACRFALVDRAQWDDFANDVSNANLDIERVSAIKGFSYSTGKAIDMELVRRAPEKEDTK